MKRCAGSLMKPTLLFYERIDTTAAMRSQFSSSYMQLMSYQLQSLEREIGLDSGFGGGLMSGGSFPNSLYGGVEDDPMI